jgi:uncharacterized protein (DUF2252 family)
VGLAAQLAAQNPLRPSPDAIDTAAPEFVDRLRADPFAYFRFINRAWTARVCEAFADIPDPTIVHLHGDAHVEQFAYTKDAWGLHDFDDSTRGPAYVDVVRFLGSIDLATRQRGWTGDRDALWNRFFEGYRRGLSQSHYRPPELALIRWLRQQTHHSRAASLAWGESQMQPMQEAQSRAVLTGMAALERLVRANRSDLAPGYFAVVRAGWLRFGVGSAATRKVLVRVQGKTPDPGDDLLLEAKEVANLGGLPCLEGSTTPQAARVIAGTRQLGRLKHDILAIGPTMLIPAAADRAEHWLDWWVSSWEPTYQEVRLTDIRSVDDLADIVYDAGVQLGASKLVSERKQVLSSVTALESRLRTETARIVEELLAGWRQLRVR